MTRRKSVCLKWTLVLLVVVFSPSVYPRPQESVAPSSDLSDKSTESPIRYNLGLSSFKRLPIVIRLVNISTVELNNSQLDSRYNIRKDDINKDGLRILNNNTNPSRIGRRIYSNTPLLRNKHKVKPVKVKTYEAESKKSPIRKVITKWRDKTKLDDIQTSYGTTKLPHSTKYTTKFVDARPTEEMSTESSEEIDSKRYTRPPNDYNYHMYNKPSQYSEETHVYSTNIQVIDTQNRPTRPPYFHTNIPTPTPVITNLGYPQPWSPNTRRTTTQRPYSMTKPIKYEYHNNMNNNYDYNTYDVTTFQPNSYTERIVIRPEEYSPSAAEDCPTIYLTLNNTFQGQGKEACPDLNIAVNTNVINKNVVIESEEDEAESLFPDGFGLGLGDDSEADDGSKDEDYFATEENQDDESDASLEGTELAHYQSGNNVKKPSTEPGSFGSANSPSSAITLPGGAGHSDDDIFGLSSLVDFFKPAFSALSWLANINPFSIGILPILLAPLGFLFAGSGLAALFAPLFFPYAREAPKVIHVYPPEWHWDNELKSWHLNSFPNNRKAVPELGRSSKEKQARENVEPTLFSRFKTWMMNMTNKLKAKTELATYGREERRKKRNIHDRQVIMQMRPNNIFVKTKLTNKQIGQVT